MLGCSRPPPHSSSPWSGLLRRKPRLTVCVSAGRDALLAAAGDRTEPPDQRWSRAHTHTHRHRACEGGSRRERAGERTTGERAGEHESLPLSHAVPSLPPSLPTSPLTLSSPLSFINTQSSPSFSPYPPLYLIPFSFIFPSSCISVTCKLPLPLSIGLLLSQEVLISLILAPSSRFADVSGFYACVHTIQ